MLPARWVDQHQGLPFAIRLQWLLPATCLLVIFLGVTFTLPPGPLSDESMILFMEGGCDWGESNIFFFSKLGLLISINMAFTIAWRRSVRQGTAFAPHFLAAAALTFLTWSGGRCDDYYVHPNGSIGQMVIEASAFAALGILILRKWAGSRSWMLAVVLVAWNAVHVLTFYVWLIAFDHWLWLHTVAVCLSLLAIGAAMSLKTSFQPAANVN
jgi:hypothetical protein